MLPACVCLLCTCTCICTVVCASWGGMCGRGVGEKCVAPCGPPGALWCKSPGLLAPKISSSTHYIEKEKWMGGAGLRWGGGRVIKLVGMS